MIAAAALLTACGGSPDEAPASEKVASVETFTPPSPLGCAAAGAYDYCFAFDRGTPLAVRVALPSATPTDAVAEVSFHVEDGHVDAVLNEVRFSVKPDRDALVLYFQVYPATYIIDVSVAGARGTTERIDVGASPIATSVALE